MHANRTRTDESSQERVSMREQWIGRAQNLLFPLTRVGLASRASSLLVERNVQAREELAHVLSALLRLRVVGTRLGELDISGLQIQRQEEAVRTKVNLNRPQHTISANAPG